MAAPVNVPILRVADQTWIEAQIVEMLLEHVVTYESEWLPQLVALESWDAVWNWGFKFRIAKSTPGIEAYSLICQNKLQALMLIDIRKRSLIDRNLQLVYIEYLVTAPTNRQRNIQREFSGAGTALVRFAFQRSLELGYPGGIALHAVDEALPFYRKLRLDRPLTCYSRDPEKDDLMYFETFRMPVRDYEEFDYDEGDN